jgi:hypothetical protein
MKPGVHASATPERANGAMEDPSVAWILPMSLPDKTGDISLLDRRCFHASLSASFPPAVPLTCGHSVNSRCRAETSPCQEFSTKIDRTGTSLDPSATRFVNCKTRRDRKRLPGEPRRRFHRLTDVARTCTENRSHGPPFEPCDGDPIHRRAGQCDHAHCRPLATDRLSRGPSAPADPSASVTPTSPTEGGACRMSSAGSPIAESADDMARTSRNTRNRD